VTLAIDGHAFGMSLEIMRRIDMSGAKQPKWDGEENVIDWAASLPPRPQPKSSTRALIDELNAYSTVGLERCQSPIEEAMLGALLECGLNTDKREFWSSGRTTLFQQVPVQTSIGEFWLDFALMRPVGKHVLRLAVEVDGYDIHHGSVEVVDKDNRRTRALAKRGWMVIRFSGSEIMKNPTRCAFEAFAVVVENLDLIVSGRRK
jgi:very-short-patch-repair endonuclease